MFVVVLNRVMVWKLFKQIVEGVFFVLPVVGPSSPSRALEVIKETPAEYALTF